MFKFYLDNTPVSDPLNWADFTETIERDDAIKGLLPKYEQKLNFNAGGYKYISDSLKLNGFCKLIELRIDYKCGGAYETVLNGYIFISDCKFDLDNCIVECDVMDDSFGARIYNNKKIKAYLNTTKSKNGTTITAANSIPTTMFVPTTGAQVSGDRDVYLVADAFRFLIDFMTDGLVGFESTYLTTSSDTFFNKLGLIIGKELRSPQSAAPYISFEDLFTEVNKKFPIGFTIIRDSAGKPVIKIENEPYFNNNGTSLTIPNVKGVKESFDNEKLYSKVKFGGTVAGFNASIHHFGQIQFLSFKNEEYHLEGECNIDKALDLVGTFIVDSNIIEELVATNTTNDGYDEDTFFIETSPSFAVSTANPTTNGLPFYYNGRLTNNKVAERYSLANNLALYLGTGIAGFRASDYHQTYLGYDGRPGGTDSNNNKNTLRTHGPFIVEFDNDSTPPNFDASGNYNTSTYRYTSPQDGNYQFSARVNFRVVGCVDMNQNKSIIECNSIIGLYTFLRKYDAANNLIESYRFGSANYVGSGGFITSGNFGKLIYLPENYYCRVEVEWTYQSSDTLWNSCAQVYIEPFNGLYTQFLTTATTTGGGIYKYEAPGNYFVSKQEFERPLSHFDYKTLKLDLSKNLVINRGDKANKTAWIRKTVRNYTTSETKFELISSVNNSL